MLSRAKETTNQQCHGEAVAKWPRKPSYQGSYKAAKLPTLG